MSTERMRAAIAALHAAVDELAGCDVDAMSPHEVTAALADLEAVTRRLPAPRHRMITRLARESPITLGARSLRDALALLCRTSRGEASRRIKEADQLGPRTAVTGQPLAPILAATATAQAQGAIGTEHVGVIRRFFQGLPGWVDVTTREQAEDTLVRIASGLGPDELTAAANRLAALIDQDGPEPDDAERARKRGLWIGQQRSDGMTSVRGLLNPEALATWEAIAAKWAAPGMCNPDDASPCTSGTPAQDRIDGDHHSVGQRNHDALIAIGRSVLSSGELGQHNGLPATIVVRTSLKDLETGSGVGVTGGGSLLPITDVLRLATHAHHYLAVFDHRTEESLFLFRSKRVASPAQRIMLIARDGGCTKPGCDAPPYRCQAHHAVADWADGGNTNIDELALACGPDNRMVGSAGWTTTINARGQAEWIPPPILDTGQPRTHDYHHPERLLSPPDDEIRQPGGPEPPDCAAA